MNLDDKEKVRDALEKIDLAGKHLLGLLNGVLDMSKIESGSICLEEAPFSLSASLESVYALIQPEAQAKGQTMTMDAANLRHPDVVGDDRRLQQVLLNLLTNAVRFTPAGGKITLAAYEEPGVLSGWRAYRFVVTDTGIGMEPAFLKRIFEPFARAADTRTTQTDGTGLGLPIAQNIAQMMGGDIQVESEVGKGSRFTVQLSLKQNRGKHTAAQALPHVLSDFQRHTYTGKRVLLVEDNQLNSEVAGELLTSVGLAVDYVGNGREGVEKIAQSAPGTYDLVLMDIQMPEMNGYEAAAAIRTLDRADTKTLPIVAMTADAFAEDAQRAREAGMNGHMAKPVDLGKLEKVLREWI
jgi:CheY-like chemotaxis protein